MDLFESGDEARCCGSSGAWRELRPDAADRAALLVTDDISDSGAASVVTTSPSCRVHLAEQLPDDIRVYDLVDLVNALPGES